MRLVVLFCQLAMMCLQWNSRDFYKHLGFCNHPYTYCTYCSKPISLAGTFSEDKIMYHWHRYSRRSSPRAKDQRKCKISLNQNRSWIETVLIGINTLLGKEHALGFPEIWYMLSIFLVRTTVQRFLYNSYFQQHIHSIHAPSEVTTSSLLYVYYFKRSQS